MSTKTKLLDLMKKQDGQWLSGEGLSRQLAVSRAAIWKHIHNLRDEGYIIDSSTRKGYLLRESADRLAADEIGSGWTSGIFGAEKIIHHDVTDSTNRRAMALAAGGAPEGTLVVAETQTGGRGRRGRVWFSPAGDNIYASVILRPTIPPGQAPRITLMAAVALAEALRKQTELPARIKWPNDILISGKKIAGILTEISTDMDRVDYVVIGLGVNVNTRAADLPSDIARLATSVRIAGGRRVSRAALLRSILESIDACYAQFQVEGFSPIMDRWRRHNNVIGQRVTVDMLGTRHTGVVENVDDDGVLILRTDDGGLKRIFSGDVTRLRPE